MVKELLLKFLPWYEEKISSLGKINNLMVFVYSSRENELNFGSPIRSDGDDTKGLEKALSYLNSMSHRRGVSVYLWEQDAHDRRVGIVKMCFEVNNREQFNQAFSLMHSGVEYLGKKVEDFHKFDFKLK